MRLSLKLCTDIINYGCNKPKLPRQWCRRRTGPTAPSCPKAQPHPMALLQHRQLLLLETEEVSILICHLLVLISPPMSFLARGEMVPAAVCSGRSHQDDADPRQKALETQVTLLPAPHLGTHVQKQPFAMCFQGLCIIMSLIMGIRH